MSASSSREQLNDYFAAELSDLRTRAIEFAEENPNIAEELMLNQHNDGKSRDPHVEVLIQSFAWLTSRLRQNIESESAKLPALLLQQLYPQLISSMPSMAIAEFDVNGFSANFEQGYVLPERQMLEPTYLDANSKAYKKLQQCKLSTCYDTVLWPLKTAEVALAAINDHVQETRSFRNAQSAIKVKLIETDPGAAKATKLTKPLRFYLNVEEEHKYKFYDHLAKHFIGAVVLQQSGGKTIKLNADNLKVCGFADEERLFPADVNQDLGFSLLQDYFNYPDKFMFVELTGLEQVQIKDQIELLLLFDENLSPSVKLNNQALKLNCAPIINLFTKTTEPLPVHFKDYRYKLYPSREHYDCYEVVKVDKLYSVNKQGESKELLPYFSLTNKGAAGANLRWLVQQENSHKKQLSGTDSWLSVFDIDFQRTSPIGETLFAQTWCSNRSLCEMFSNSQTFAVTGSSPVKQVKLLTRPSRHRGSHLDKEHLWQILSHLSVYYVSLTDPALAKDTLTRFLSLYANKKNPVSLRKIESIEKIEIEPDVQPLRNGGWRGYYQGTKFIITLTERKLSGISIMLFGRVIQQFLALFCHINSFVRVELRIGNRSVHQWQPLSGHQSLI